MTLNDNVDTAPVHADCARRRRRVEPEAAELTVHAAAFPGQSESRMGPFSEPAFAGADTSTLKLCSMRTSTALAMPPDDIAAVTLDTTSPAVRPLAAVGASQSVDTTSTESGGAGGGGEGGGGQS